MLHTEDLFEQCMALRCEVKAQARIIKEFKSGKRYLKLQADQHRVIEGYVKDIRKLRLELADAHARIVSTRNTWADDYYALYDEYQAEIRKRNERIRKLEDDVWKAKKEGDDKLSAKEQEYEDRLYEKDCIINKLKNELAHVNALLGRDSSNTGLPTSQTPAGKEKRIPNSREKSGRPKGGQPGHPKHVLEEPDDLDITDISVHDNTGTEGFFCPSCGIDSYVPTGETEVKYEYDVEIKVKKIKHIFYYYQCLECGTEFRSLYPANIRGDVQYGSMVQALALSLTNTTNAAMNKTAMFLAGITGGELTPCEGYIAKLQKRAAKNLMDFREDSYKYLILRKLIYWDDTVIMIMTKRGCFRFYGDETIAYYTSHEKKDMTGIDEDNVLGVLTSDTTVMHDHNTLNYNKKFKFKNIECNEHAKRDCQKNSDDTQHKWSGKLKKLIGKAIKDRKDAIARGESSFSKEYVKQFHEKLEEYLADGWSENEPDKDKYGAVFERSLLRRFRKYKNNYFKWLEDFSLPPFNNLSERSLRCVKSHMKISGQFESVEAAENYAIIKSYIETCRRNKVNEMDALKRLCEGKPYTIQEILSNSPPR